MEIKIQCTVVRDCDGEEFISERVVKVPYVTLTLLNDIRQLTISSAEMVDGIHCVKNVRVITRYFEYYHVDSGWIEKLRSTGRVIKSGGFNTDDMKFISGDPHICNSIKIVSNKLEALRHSIYIDNPDKIDNRLKNICIMVNDIAKSLKQVARLNNKKPPKDFNYDIIRDFIMNQD